MDKYANIIISDFKPLIVPDVFATGRAAFLGGVVERDFCIALKRYFISIKIIHFQMNDR